MKNNLQALRLENGYKAKRHFANLLEINEGNYGKMERGELPISANVKISLQEKFPLYNIDWIVENKGARLKREQPIGVRNIALSDKTDPGGMVLNNSSQFNREENHPYKTDTNNVSQVDDQKNDLWEIIKNQQQQIKLLYQNTDLLYKQVELLNNLLPKS